MQGTMCKLSAAHSQLLEAPLFACLPPRGFCPGKGWETWRSAKDLGLHCKRHLSSPAAG